VLAAIAGYEYQACEHDGWRRSETARFCQALRLAMVRRLPGYDQAPWTWSAEELTAARARQYGIRAGDRREWTR
jgi:hypothetical protein